MIALPALALSYAAAEAITIDIDQPTIACGGLCPSFTVTLTARNQVRSARHTLHGEEPARGWTLSTFDARTLRAELDPFRRLGDATLCTDGGRVTPYAIMVRWSGPTPDESARCEMQGMRATVGCALFRAGIDPLTGRRLTRRQTRFILSLETRARKALTGGVACPARNGPKRR